MLAAAEAEVAVVVVTDLTAHLALTRSASPARHPRQRDEELAEDVGLEKQEEAV